MDTHSPRLVFVMSQPVPRDPRDAGAGARPLGPGASSPPVLSPAPASPASPPGTRWQRSRWLLLLSVLGPGVIAAAAGNDAGGIATYSQAGAGYGLSLLWSIVVIAVGLIVVQEMCARMGAVTGKGLAALIRENFGVKVTLFAMIVLLLANFATTVSEFAGITAVGELYLGARARYVIVPLAVALVWLLVSRGSYQKVERVLLVASAVFVTYIIAALKVGVPWAAVAQASLGLHIARTHWSAPLALMLVQLIGTTIAPYMQFYQQSAVRDKGVKMKDYFLTRWDTIIGCVLSNIVAIFIVVLCTQTLYSHNIRIIKDAGDAAQALAPLAGSAAKLLFAFGLLNASLIAAVIVPLSTSYAVTEALGWESGLGRRIRDLPLFYGTYGFLIVAAGALIMLLPLRSNLIQVILNAQIVNCALLPIELVLMLLLINRRRVMGQYRNSLGHNIVAWTTTIVAAGLSLWYFVFKIIHPHG